MRHGKKFNHLGRKAAHRRALLKNLSIALIEHKRIETTLAKAKAPKIIPNGATPTNRGSILVAPARNSILGVEDIGCLPIVSLKSHRYDR